MRIQITDVCGVILEEGFLISKRGIIFVKVTYFLSFSMQCFEFCFEFCFRYLYSIFILVTMVTLVNLVTIVTL